MITYNKIREIKEKWGIDVTVIFTILPGKTITKTFRFNDQKSLDLEFESRMQKAISNIENSIAEQLKPDESVIADQFEKYFEVNDKLILTKENYEKLKDDGILTSTIKEIK